jgi:hypothetical protein
MNAPCFSAKLVHRIANSASWSLPRRLSGRYQRFLAMIVLTLIVPLNCSDAFAAFIAYDTASKLYG